MPNTHTLSDIIDFTQLFPPASRTVAATGSTYIDMAGFEVGVVLVDIGAMAANATFDAQVVQATAAAGTGTKSLAGAVLVQLVQTPTDGSNKLYAIEFRTAQLDIANGFHFVHITITPATAAVIGGVVLIRHRSRVQPVSTSLTQQVKV